MNELITVGIPTYNRSYYLESCLEALRRQGLPNGILKVVISDNASDDDTMHIVSQFNDLNIHYSRNASNLGHVANYKIVWNSFCSEYSLILCDDDWLEDGFLLRALNYMNNNDDVVMYSGSTAYHDEDTGKLISVMRPLLYDLNHELYGDSVTWTLEELISMCAIQTPVFAGGTLIRTSAIKECSIDPEYYYSAEKILYTKIAKNGKAHFNNSVSAHCRWHQNNLTKTFDMDSAADEFRASTKRVIELAFEQGINVPDFWHTMLKSMSRSGREIVLKKFSYGFNRDEIRSIINGDGYAFNDLRSEYRESLPSGSENAAEVLAIFTPNIGTYSETFIRRHIQHIAPGRTVVVTSNIYDKSWLNCPYLIIPGSEGPKTYYTAVEKIVTEFLRYHKVTHILCEYGSFLTEIVELNHRVLRLPIFVHFFGGDASEFLYDPRMTSYYTWMGQQVTGVIAIAKPMAERLKDAGIPGEKISIIHLGIEIPETIRSNPETEPCRFISVARLVPKKGHLLTLKAFAQALTVVPNLKLDIIGGGHISDSGDGQLSQEIIDYIHSNNLGNFVTLHGGQPLEYVLRCLHESSVYVQHSITDPETGDAEGLPIIILEASAAGLPIISTRHEGIPEEVEHGVTGFLVDEFDVDNMTKYMVLLATNPKMRSDMGLAARNKMMDEFSLPVSIDNLSLKIGITPGRRLIGSVRGLGTAHITWNDMFRSLRIKLYATGLAVCIAILRTIGLSKAIGAIRKRFGLEPCDTKRC